MADPTDDNSGTPFRPYLGGWVTMPNEAVNDDRLSFRARGLLAYLLGRPPGWRFSAERIAARSPKEGREAVLTALSELEQTGYIRRRRLRSEAGTLTTITEAAALPSLLPPVGTPGSAQPAPVQPGPVNPLPKSVPERAVNPEEVITPAATRRGRAIPVTAWPGPDDALYAWAKEHGWTRTDVDHEAQQLRAWAESKDERKVKWNAALRLWLGKRKPPRPSSTTRSVHFPHGVPTGMR